MVKPLEGFDAVSYVKSWLRAIVSLVLDQTKDPNNFYY